MNVATPNEVRRLLTGRLEIAGRSGERFTVGELLDKFLPYRFARGELSLATKSEYDLTMLGLLNSGHLRLSESLSDAVQDELGKPEPALEFLGAWLDQSIDLGAPGAASSGSPASLEHGASGAETAAPPFGVPEVDSAPEMAGTADPGFRARTVRRESEPRACRGCERALPARDGLRFCPYCGRDQTVSRCAACGERVDDEWTYCPRCGREVGA